MTGTWTSDARVLVVAGKGGVGTTTTAAAIAVVAAGAGADVLVIGVDDKPGLGTVLGGAGLGPREQVLAMFPGGGRIRGRTVPPAQAFGDYLDLKGAGALVRRAATAASLDLVAAATPGLEHLLVLGKVKELEREAAADLIVVDAPPAGNAGPFLRAASALSETVSSGPIRDQAIEVAAMLTDPTRARVAVVTLAEETPVTEALELDAEVRAMRISVQCVVVNGCWTDRPGLFTTVTAATKAGGVRISAADRRTLEAVRQFGAARATIQHDQIRRLVAELDVPVLRLPKLMRSRLGRDDIGVLAAALREGGAGR